jgi:hypothetical protein
MPLADFCENPLDLASLCPLPAMYVLTEGSSIYCESQLFTYYEVVLTSKNDGMH